MATTVTIYRLCVDGDMENCIKHGIRFHISGADRPHNVVSGQTIANANYMPCELFVNLLSYLLFCIDFSFRREHTTELVKLYIVINAKKIARHIISYIIFLVFILDPPTSASGGVEKAHSVSWLDSVKGT